jgi:hypothetical protein
MVQAFSGSKTQTKRIICVGHHQLALNVIIILLHHALRLFKMT